MTIQKKAVGYCRVSSESQIDNTSIDNQIQKIKEYCKLYDIELLKIFVDEGESAKDIKKRKSYADMLEFINNTRIDSVIVYKSDRIHRTLKNLLIMIEDVLTPQNIAFISITENFDTTTSQGMLFLQMIGSFGEFERKLINERTKSGRVKKGQDGKYSGGRVPYGYDLKDNSTLVKNKQESLIVKKIFNLRLEGYTLDEIATTLNNGGILTRNNKQWFKTSISYILNNRIYIGEYSYNGSKESNGIKFKVDKIISKQLWNKVHQ